MNFEPALIHSAYPDQVAALRLKIQWPRRSQFVTLDRKRRIIRIPRPAIHKTVGKRVAAVRVDRTQRSHDRRRCSVLIHRRVAKTCAQWELIHIRNRDREVLFQTTGHLGRSNERESNSSTSVRN